MSFAPTVSQFRALTTVLSTGSEAVWNPCERCTRTPHHQRVIPSYSGKRQTLRAVHGGRGASRQGGEYQAPPSHGRDCRYGRGWQRARTRRRVKNIVGVAWFVRADSATVSDSRRPEVFLCNNKRRCRKCAVPRGTRVTAGHGRGRVKRKNRRGLMHQLVLATSLGPHQPRIEARLVSCKQWICRAV